MDQSPHPCDFGFQKSCCLKHTSTIQAGGATMWKCAGSGLESELNTVRPCRQAFCVHAQLLLCSAMQVLPCRFCCHATLCHAKFVHLPPVHAMHFTGVLAVLSTCSCHAHHKFAHRFALFSSHAQWCYCEKPLPCSGFYSVFSFSRVNQLCIQTYIVGA